MFNEKLSPRLLLRELLISRQLPIMHPNYVRTAWSADNSMTMSSSCFYF